MRAGKVDDMHGEFESFKDELVVDMTHDNPLPPPAFSSPSREINLWEPQPPFPEETVRIVRMTVDRQRNYRGAEAMSEPVSSILLLHAMRDPNTLYSRAGTCCEPFHTFIFVESSGTYFILSPNPTLVFHLLIFLLYL